MLLAVSNNIGDWAAIAIGAIAVTVTHIVANREKNR